MLDENGMPQKEEVEVKIPAFRAVSVFDVSQTDGEPIPELEAKELLSTVEGYEDFINAVTFIAPVPIRFEDIPGDSNGYFIRANLAGCLAYGLYCAVFYLACRIILQKHLNLD